MSIQRVSVLGAGAWGTALANVAANARRAVTIWEHDADAAAQLSATRESMTLKGVKLNERVTITGDLKAAAKADAILLVVPAQVVRDVAGKLNGVINDGTPVVVCAKGIERGSQAFMTDVIGEAAPAATPAILSGPSFAADVARGLPTAVTVAAKNLVLAEELAQALGSGAFRPYHTADVRGVEIGGAVKNVLAIASGIVTGKGLGQSAAAALTTRGFAEMVRFGKAFGGKPDTMMGLSGLGDLILTSTSPMSRNLTFGINLGKGQSPRDLEKTTGLAEGAHTAQVLADMAKDRGVEMPIANAVAAIVEGRSSVDAAIEALLARPLKAET